MDAHKNMLLYNSYNKPIAIDIFFQPTRMPKPVIIYAHGFNGFKDWGNFDLIATQFAAAGFVFIKFNFAFNGTTPEHPEEFVDLDAYVANNYTKELEDLGAVIDWATAEENPFKAEIDHNKIGLLGHSLGGGITIIKASEDARIKALVTWASIAECQTPWTNWPEARMKEWKETGVQYVANSRTNQQMPLGYQLYEDYATHQEKLSIEQAVKQLSIPILLCHGTEDPAVPVQKAYQLQQWQPVASLFTVASDHVFGRRHPWPEQALPEPMQQVVDKSIEFYCRHLV